MRLKNEIFANGFIDALNKLIEQRLPISQAFKLRKLAKELSEKQKVYEEARVALVNQYGEKKENGSLNTSENGTVPLIDVEGFNKDFMELLSIEEKYEVSKIKLDESVEISTKDLAVLELILEEV